MVKVDTDLLLEAMKLSGHKTKKGVAEAALKEYLLHHKKKNFKSKKFS